MVHPAGGKLVGDMIGLINSRFDGGGIIALADLLQGRQGLFNLLQLAGRQQVRIGSNSWIGTRATILDGVTIGQNAIVGAHSLVKDDVPDGAVVAGTPAKILSVKDIPAAK